jgi:hypothetical protein
MKQILSALLAATFAAAAGAAPIYKCGPDGKTYSQVPCAGGAVVESTDGRTSAQRAEAKRAVEAQRKAADEMERERKAAEKDTKPAAAVAIGPAASAPADDAKKPKAVKAAASGSKGFLAIKPAAKASAN